MPAETTHHVGGTKHFECRVKGHPRPEIRWYKDGKEITQKSRYQFEHSSEGVVSMVIPNITHDDEGHYRCRAENSEGFASTSAYLLVRSHKEHPEEASTSVHAMQIEEAVLFSEREKKLRQETKAKISEHHFDKPIEDINREYMKERRVLQEDWEIAPRLGDNVKLSSSTEIISTSTSAAKSTRKEVREVAEQESTKISVDTSEKSYQSSEESGDDADSVRLRTISERSETISVQESVGGFRDTQEKASLLMRQIKRLFSEDLTGEGDLSQSEAATMMEVSATKTKLTSVTAKETFTSSGGSTKEDLFGSASDEPSLDPALDVLKGAVTSCATQTYADGKLEVRAQTSVSSTSVSETRAGTSFTSVTEFVGQSEESRSESRSSRILLAQAEVETKLTKSQQGETQTTSSSSISDISRSDTSLTVMSESTVSDSTSDKQGEAVSKFKAEVKVNDTSERSEDNDGKIFGVTKTKFSGRLYDEDLEPETRNVVLVDDEEEEESEAGSFVGSVVGVDTDSVSFQSQKVQKQESKERDEAEEKVRLPAALEVEKRSGKVKEEKEEEPRLNALPDIESRSRKVKADKEGQAEERLNARTESEKTEAGLEVETRKVRVESEHEARLNAELGLERKLGKVNDEEVNERTEEDKTVDVPAPGKDQDIGNKQRNKGRLEDEHDDDVSDVGQRRRTGDGTGARDKLEKRQDESQDKLEKRQDESQDKLEKRQDESQDKLEKKQDESQDKLEKRQDESQFGKEKSEIGDRRVVDTQDENEDVTRDDDNIKGHDEGRKVAEAGDKMKIVGLDDTRDDESREKTRKEREADKRRKVSEHDENRDDIREGVVADDRRKVVGDEEINDRRKNAVDEKKDEWKEDGDFRRKFSRDDEADDKRKITRDDEADDRRKITGDIEAGDKRKITGDDDKLHGIRKDNEKKDVEVDDSHKDEAYFVKKGNMMKEEEIEKYEAHDEKSFDVRKEVDNSLKVEDTEMIDDNNDTRKTKMSENDQNGSRKHRLEDDTSLQDDRLPQDDDEGSSEETLEQRVSWVRKVEEEEDGYKSEKRETEDGTMKGGDRKDETPPSLPKIVQKMENTKIESGKTLKLRAQVQATPRARATWSRDDQLLREGERITIVTEDDVYSLEIEGMTESDAGTYRLTAVNSAGEIFSDVVVSVLSAVPSTLSPGDRELSLTATVGIPQFLVRPQDVHAAEFETIKLTCTVTGDPTPKVTWERDGQQVRSNRRVRVYESRGVYNLEIHDCEAGDAGEYVCAAVNSRGRVTASVNVIIEGAESVMSTSGPAEQEDLMAQPLDEAQLGATAATTESSSDELFLKSYLVVMDYTDPDTQTTFSGGQLVEVLDSRQKSGHWLIRGKLEKDKVCFIPSYLLCVAGGVGADKKEEEDTDEEELSQKKKERKSNHSPKSGAVEVDNDTSEDELRLRETYPDYVAIADYVPPAGDTTSTRLSEGQIVEVIDMERPDLWLVKTRPTKTSPSRQGWVPSAYLEEKSISAQFMRRSTRGTFREEVLQVSNKQQEATLKRRYVVKEMEETEREYIRDLKMLVETYMEYIISHREMVPEIVSANVDTVFSNIMDILKFHDSHFLADITECCARPSAIGSVFLKWQCEFDNYVQFWSDREPATFLLETDEVKHFFRELKRKSSTSENDITDLLRKPVERLKMYQLLLKDVLRYAARAGDDCSEVEAASAMLIAIEKAVANRKLLPLLEGFEDDTGDLGNLLRHDDMSVWEGDVSSSRVKDRHVFLFADKIVLTKKKKPELSCDQAGFSYRSSVELSSVRVREDVADDDRKFELWFIEDSAVEKITFQARSGPAKQAWLKDIRQALVKLGVSDPDKMPEKISEPSDELTPRASPESSPPALREDEHEDAGKESADERDLANHATAVDEDIPSKPFIRNLQKKVVCQEGHPVRIDCSLGGNPCPSVTWYKGGKLVKGDGITITSEGQSSSLLFAQVTGDNSGSYTVTLANRLGSLSSNFDLIVQEDLTETDTSTDRTTGETADTESGSETVIEEIYESFADRKGFAFKREVTNKERSDKTTVTREDLEESEDIKQKSEESQEHQTEVKQRIFPEEEVVFGTESTRSISQKEEFETTTLAVSSTLNETSIHKVQSEVLTFTSHTSVDSSSALEAATQNLLSTETEIFRSESNNTVLEFETAEEEEEFVKPHAVNLSLGSETSLDSPTYKSAKVTPSSLSFDTEISSSETAKTIFGLKTEVEEEKLHSVHLAVSSDTSVDSSTYKKTDVTPSSLTFDTEISSSETAETVFDLKTEVQQESAKLRSENLGVSSETSVDSSTYKKTEVTPSSLTSDTEISSSETAETVFDLKTEVQQESAKLRSENLGVSSETSVDSSTYKKTEVTPSSLTFDTEISSSETAETVFDLKTEVQQESAKLRSENLGVSSETSVDSSTYKKTDVTPSSLTFDTEISSSETADTIFDLKTKVEEEKLHSIHLAVSSDTSVDSLACKKIDVAPSSLTFDTEISSSETAETVFDLKTEVVQDSAKLRSENLAVSSETSVDSSTVKKKETSPTFEADISNSVETLLELNTGEQKETARAETFIYQQEQLKQKALGKAEETNVVEESFVAQIAEEQDKEKGNNLEEELLVKTAKQEDQEHTFDFWKDILQERAKSNGVSEDFLVTEDSEPLQLKSKNRDRASREIFAGAEAGGQTETPQQVFAEFGAVPVATVQQVSETKAEARFGSQPEVCESIQVEAAFQDLSERAGEEKKSQTQAETTLLVDSASVPTFTESKVSKVETDKASKREDTLEEDSYAAGRALNHSPEQETAQQKLEDKTDTFSRTAEPSEPTTEVTEFLEESSGQQSAAFESDSDKTLAQAQKHKFKEQEDTNFEKVATDKRDKSLFLIEKSSEEDKSFSEAEVKESLESQAGAGLSQDTENTEEVREDKREKVKEETRERKEEEEEDSKKQKEKRVDIKEKVSLEREYRDTEKLEEKPLEREYTDTEKLEPKEKPFEKEYRDTEKLEPKEKPLEREYRDTEKLEPKEKPLEREYRDTEKLEPKEKPLEKECRDTEKLEPKEKPFEKEYRDTEKLEPKEKQFEKEYRDTEKLEPKEKQFEKEYRDTEKLEPEEKQFEKEYRDTEKLEPKEKQFEKEYRDTEKLEPKEKPLEKEYRDTEKLEEKSLKKEYRDTEKLEPKEKPLEKEYRDTEKLEEKSLKKEYRDTEKLEPKEKPFEKEYRDTEKLEEKPLGREYRDTEKLEPKEKPLGREYRDTENLEPKEKPLEKEYRDTEKLEEKSLKKEYRDTEKLEPKEKPLEKEYRDTEKLEEKPLGREYRDTEKLEPKEKPLEKEYRDTPKFEPTEKQLEGEYRDTEKSEPAESAERKYREKEESKQEKDYKDSKRFQPTEKTSEREYRATEKVFVEEGKERKQRKDSDKVSAPRFVKAMDDCVTELGELARFDCRVSAYPDPEITWYKDGNKVTPSAKYELLNFHDDIFSLLIKKVDKADSGRYTCVAKNDYGEAKTEALLNVLGLKEKITDAHVAPSFLTKFYDMEAIEGVPVEFVCIIDGNPDPSVTWFLNGREVENSSEILTRRQEDTVMLAFRSVKIENSGEIICKLKNDAGQALCKARLKVKEDLSKKGDRPLFLEQPSDKEVEEGGEVTFECVISGLPEPEVTWYFNGRELHESRRRSMRRKAGQKYTLTIKDVIPENAGVYTCKAVNRAGDASCAVELSVKELPTDQFLKGKLYDGGIEYDTSKYAFPPAFTRRIQDERGLPGRMARFEAMAIGIPEPEVEWQKDGFPLKYGPKYKMGREGNTAILVVENCDVSDEGTYTCNLFNDAGKASCSAQLRVQGDKYRPSLPRFMSPARDIYRASPAPSAKRTVEREIPLEDKIPSMVIDKPATLDVRPNSVKLSWMPAPTAMLPENARKISYTIEARQLPSNQWVRLDSNIEATTHYVYGLKPDTEYQFRVRAENRFGTSEPTLPCTLKPREEPKRRESVLRETETPVRPVLPKARPYVSDIGKETIQIGWKPAEVPYYPERATSMPPVTYRVEAQKLPSEEWVPLASRVKKPSIYLSDLESDRDYNIRIRAQTPYGVSQPTEPVWIPRAKAFTGVPVSRPTIAEIEEGTARLQWNRVDIPAFDSSEEPLLYMVEIQEPPSYRWRELARRVPTNYYIVRDLEPAQDYRFRVRAESRDGLLSEPSPATSLFRTLALSHTPVDHLEVEEYDPDLQSARLSWRRVEIPPYGTEETPLLYMIEYESPGVEGWRPLVSGIPTTQYRVPDISPTDDYRFRVRALSPYGVSPPSYPTELYRRPSPMRPLPQDLHISSLEPEGVRLSWRSVSVPPAKAGEPVSYQIEAMEYPKQEWRPLATNIRDTSYHLGGLKPSTDYSFRVRAQTPLGLAEPTPPVTLTSLPVRPRLPVREPIVSEIGSDAVRLQWKPAELPYYSRRVTPITYTVDYQEVPGRDWVVAARGIPDTSYTFRGLRGDRDYRFRVCPETEYGPGEYSLPAHIHRRTVPSLPTREPLLSNISPTSATLSWQSASLARGAPTRPVTYRVEGREPPSSVWYDVAGQIPTTSHTLHFLDPDQEYMFRVFADYDGLESEPTMAVYLPRRAGPPKMPRDAPYVSSVQPESVILSWRSVELPSRITDYTPVSYRVEVQEGPNSDWRPLARQINQTHFHATKLRPDIDYSFRVRAENEFGISDPTDSVLIRKRAVPPVLSPHEPLISDVRADSLRLTWQPAEMPSYLTDSVPVTYTVLMQEEGDHSWQPIARRVAGTSYYMMGLAPDKDYSFRIQAENSFGTSLPSFPCRLHRRHAAAIYSPEIEDVDLTSFRLSWKQPALSKPTTYSVETLEPSTWKWRPLVSRLPHPSYRVTGIQPAKDYAFRVRAEVDSVITEPSLPISFSTRRVDGRAISEQPVSKKALPNIPVERPTLSEVYDDSVRVNWQPTYYHGSSRKHLPQYYRLEVREMPDTNWHTLVPRTDARSYEVTDLRPNQDYAFRVRSVTDTGMSEPSLPVFLYRQAATPRIPLPSPEISDLGEDYIGLRWQLVDIPAFDVDETPLSFMIEAQRVPDYDWRPVARGVTGTSHKVTGLEPKHDYQFRLRGETSVGLTQPSAPLPVYRTPVRTGVPITNLRIDTDSNQPYSAKLRWSPVYISPYGANTNITYTVEVQEPPRTDWYPIARDISGTSYTVPELSPRKDYLFRVRAKSPSGEYSAPTPAVPYYRSPVTAWDKLQPAGLTYPMEEYAPIARPYIEGLILKVPPRMSIEKPDMFVVSPECVSLSWKAARVPTATANLSPTTYRVEVRHEDSFEWIEKATGVKGLTAEVRGLNPHLDYAFRVRAVNDFGWSESTLPAFLHRPQELKDDFQFEEFETYGGMLGDISVPRMPMDTPRMSSIQDRSLSLTWTPARIPAYARKTPILYSVEKKEPTDLDWVPLASRIPDTVYTVRNIEPKQDYLFRIRAENEHGISEATLPAALTRSKTPHFVRSSASREREFDSSGSRQSPFSFIDSISAGVPPRVPAGRPSLSDITDTSLTLSWQPGRMPSYIKGPVKIRYIVEARQPPNHLWNKLNENLTGTSFHVTGLRPDQDYMFRIRAFNDSGMSEPTLPVTLTRERAPPAEPRTMRRRSSVERFSSVERRVSRERSLSMDRAGSVPSIVSRDSSRRDEDYLTGRTPDTTTTAPEFILSESPEDQYGIDGQPVRISLKLRGFPLPTVEWYFKGKKLLFGDKYDGYVTPSGQVVLEFGPVAWDDVGDYKCVAENEQGQTSFVVKLHISDPPTFLEPIRDLQLESQGRGRFTCRVDGIPSPTVKFLKDWKPLAEASRFKTKQEGPDQWSLNIEQAVPSIAGCYVCVAENAAGKVFCTARLSVDDDIPAASVFYKKTNFEDNFYILEELGRGRYSTVRRVIERSTGQEYAAKFIRAQPEADKDFFRLELDALIRQSGPNVEKIHDAYESPQQLILVLDLVKGDNLLERVTGDKNWTEAKAARVIRFVLQALGGVHNSGFLHLDLKPTDIRFSTDDDSSLQLIDFGFSRKLPVKGDLIFNYGTPEFCSPEALDNEALTPASDLWAVGVLTHILLTGVSPFYAGSVPETLLRTRNCEWNIDNDLFSNLTASSKDFISKLLIREPQGRLSLEACLRHDWLKVAEKTDTPKLDLARLRSFHERTLSEQKALAVKTVARPVGLKSLLEGGGIIKGLRPTTDPQTGEVILPDSEAYGQFLDEESWYDWQTRHQQGGDAASRTSVKGYKKASVGDLTAPADGEDGLDSREKTRVRQELPASIEKELEWMGEVQKRRTSYDIDEVSLASKRSSVASISTEGFPGPMFKEKLHDMAFGVDDTVILRCVVVGPPTPSVVWYKNEELLADGGRYKMSLQEDGEASLTIRNAKNYDAGIYKCVGRNKFGRVSNRMRLQLGDVPGRPGQPVASQVSRTEALILWEAPKSDGHSGILFYKLDYKSPGQDRWLTGTYTSQEAAVVAGLQPSTSYHFRVSATNRFGTGHYSWASVEISTSPEGPPLITSDGFFDVAKLKLGQTSTRPIIPSEVDDIISVGEVTQEEAEPKLQSSPLDSVYNIGPLLYKGRFYEEKSLTLPSDNDRKFILRTVPAKVGQKEFDAHKSLRHERLVRLFATFSTPDYIHLVLEYTEGEHVARHLSRRRKYTEDVVASVIRQVLYALEFLQRSSWVHLNLQPASIVVSKLEGTEVKLTDFSLARKVSGPEGEIVPRQGYADFIPPEVVVKDFAGFPADVWGVGTLAFLLLSGVSPFHGDSSESTLVNIALNRYEAVDLYENVTTEGLKFLFKVLKRLPRNRPSVQECLDHKWLQLTEQTIKEREDTVFLSNTLARFVDDYDTARQSDQFRQNFEDEQLPLRMSRGGH